MKAGDWHLAGCFEPVLPEIPKLMILGSVPGKASLKQQQYYGHPRNAFWPIMADLLQFSPNLDYPERLEKLRENGILLWDVIASCQRQGSLDAAIDRTTEQHNSVAEFLVAYPQIEAIGCNGRKAYDTVQKWSKSGQITAFLEKFLLPSTSPAYAVMSYRQKRDEWGRILRYLS